MAAHSIDRSPLAFLTHANRMLSAALQTGNAHVSAQGTADLLLHAYRLGGGSEAVAPSGVGRGPGRSHLRRSARERRLEDSADGFAAIVHADYRSARCGVRAVAVAAA